MRHPQSPLPLASPMGLSLLPLVLLLIWLIFLSPLALPNMGGSGLKLPQNILTWAVMAAVTATLWLTLPANSPISLSVTARWLLLAVVILAIPLLYTSPLAECWAGTLAWVGWRLGFLRLMDAISPTALCTTLAILRHSAGRCIPGGDRSFTIDLTGNRTGLV